MHEELLPAMAFPSPSITLLKRAVADAHNSHLRTWVQTLPARIQQYLNRWQLEWTGESLTQGYLGYVLPCRRNDGAAAILKLSPDRHGAEEQVTALSAWSGNGAVPLLSESFEENGAALLLGRIIPGVALRPLDDPTGERISRCLRRLAQIQASSIRGRLPSGLERLNSLISANACHLPALSRSLQSHQDGIVALADTVARKQGPPQRVVLLHGDLHAGNLLVD